MWSPSRKWKIGILPVPADVHLARRFLCCCFPGHAGSISTETAWKAIFQTKVPRITAAADPNGGLYSERSSSYSIFTVFGSNKSFG